MKIKNVIHYIFMLQHEKGRQFVFMQELREAIEEALEEPMYYKAREDLLKIKEAIAN